MASNRRERTSAVDSAIASIPSNYSSTLIPSDLFSSDRSRNLSSNHPSTLPPDNASLVLPNPSSVLADASDSNDEPPFSRFSTLTQALGHECFNQFKDRVQTLWKSLEPLKIWQKNHPRKSLFDGRLGRYICSNKIFGSAFRRWKPETPGCKIQQMKGGSFNRVIGITIPETYKNSSSIDRAFILRIPRDEDARPDRDIATLEYIRNLSTIPVPEVLHKDFTRENPLETPYMIQKRIPGHDLALLWNRLTHEQRCLVAYDLAKTLAKLQSLTGSTPGHIEAHEEVAKGLLRTTVVPYELEGPDGPIQEPEIGPLYRSKQVSTVDFFVHQMNRWKAVELAKPWREMIYPIVEAWNILIQCAKDMDTLGLFRDDTICLCHLDLQARNIMADIQENETLKITGYLDWDSAVFAPSFVGCAPPQWMWDETAGPLDEENERGANIKPQDPQNLEIKQIFEDTVGRDYLHYAYGPQFRLARMLFRIAKDGLYSRMRFNDVDKFLDEWDQLRILLAPERTFP